MVAQEETAGAMKAGTERESLCLNPGDSDTFFINCINRLYELHRTVARCLPVTGGVCPF